MGAVISIDINTPDTANLLPPEGRAFGSEMADEVDRYLDDLKGKAMVAYAKEVKASGGSYSMYDYDFAIGFRAEVPAEMLPKKVIVKTGAIIPDYYSNFGFFFVSDAFKALVEEFDSDQHQFTPVEIVDEASAPYDKSAFYIFKCRQVLDTVDETSEALEFLRSGSDKPGDPTAFNYTVRNPFRMFKDKIGDAGLWRELRCLRSCFASEAFLQEANARNLIGVTRYTDFEEI